MVLRFYCRPCPRPQTPRHQQRLRSEIQELTGSGGRERVCPGEDALELPLEHTEEAQPSKFPARILLLRGQRHKEVHYSASLSDGRDQALQGPVGSEAAQQIQKGPIGRKCNSKHYMTQFIVEQMFHACDIGNPCLDFDNYMNWGALVSY